MTRQSCYDGCDTRYERAMVKPMNQTGEIFLDTFDRLPQQVQWHVASEILRRTVHFEFPPLSDDELILNAEMIFLSLDADEANDEA